jgi:hypothetical protein
MLFSVLESTIIKLDMARVFTTEFIFNLKHYRAIVVMQDGNNGLKIRARLFDAGHFFANDSIEFEGLSGYKKLNYLPPEAIAFLDELNKAILNHLSQ